MRSRPACNSTCAHGRSRRVDERTSVINVSLAEARPVGAEKPSLLVVINPNASRAEEALAALTEWFAANTDAVVVIAHKKRDLKESLKAHGPAADRIVIGGGVGTLSKALPSLLKLNKPLAVLPLGTANDFARTIGLPADPLQAAEITLDGREHAVDVGFANGKPYLNVASVGVAAEVIKRQSKALKQTWRVLAYAISLGRAVRRLQPFVADLEIDDRPRWSAAVYQVSVANGRYHGGGLTVAEDAAIDDGKLDLYVVYPGTFWQLFACLTHLRFGLMKKPSVLDRGAATRVKLLTARPRDVDADGRLATATPAEFTLRHKALKVIVPRKRPKDHRGLARNS
jgi:YegS/Rv2252/BmrU family lipid kinase